MKMYSNTISIVHSNFRRKESLYLFIQALFLSWTDTGFRDLRVLYISSKKYLKHFIMKLIAIDSKLQAKLKSFNYDSTHSVALSSLGLSAVDHFALRAREGLPLGALVNGAQSGAGQGREPRPGLGFLPWPVTQKYLSKPPLVTVHPPRAPGCWGPHSGWNHNWNFKFHLQFQINRNELRDEVLEIFFAIEIRAGFERGWFLSFERFHFFLAGGY